MTLAELQTRWDALSPRQQNWVRGKQRWEHMSRLGVLEEWAPPDDSELTPCGCAVCSDPDCGPCHAT